MNGATIAGNTNSAARKPVKGDAAAVLAKREPTARILGGRAVGNAQFETNAECDVHHHNERDRQADCADEEGKELGSVLPSVSQTIRLPPSRARLPRRR